MDSYKIWKIIEGIAKDLLPEIPPIEKLCPHIKDEEKLIYIMQDKKSAIAYNRILNNYGGNFKLAIERILFDEYRSAIEKGKQINPVKLKKIVGSIKRPIKEKICERFDVVQAKAKNTVMFNKKQENISISNKLYIGFSFELTKYFIVF